MADDRHRNLTDPLALFKADPNAGTRVGAELSQHLPGLQKQVEDAAKMLSSGVDIDKLLPDDTFKDMQESFRALQDSYSVKADEFVPGAQHVLDAGRYGIDDDLSAIVDMQARERNEQVDRERAMVATLGAIVEQVKAQRIEAAESREEDRAERRLLKWQNWAILIAAIVVPVVLAIVFR